MTREQLKRYTKNKEREIIAKQKEEEHMKIPDKKVEAKIESLDDVINLLFDENIKSKTVREIKVKKEFINYIQLKFQ